MNARRETATRLGATIYYVGFFALWMGVSLAITSGDRWEIAVERGLLVLGVFFMAEGRARLVVRADRRERESASSTEPLTVDGVSSTASRESR